MRVFVLRESTGELLAVAPMMITHRPGVGPSLFRELQFFGADPYVTQLRGPVCRRERLAEVGRALAAHVRKTEAHDFAQWRGMTPGFGDEQDASGVHMPQLDDVNSYLRMRESFDAFHAELPKKLASTCARAKTTSSPPALITRFARRPRLKRRRRDCSAFTNCMRAAPRSRM